VVRSNPDSSKGGTHHCVGDAERNRTGAKILWVRRELSSGQIDLRNRPSATDQPDGSARLEHLEHALADELALKRAAPTRADDEHARLRRRVGMARTVGEQTVPGICARSITRGLRPGRGHDRDRGAQQDAVHRTRAEHADERGDRHEELGPAESPDMPERLDVEEAHDGGEHDGRQHRLRQIPEQSRREDHDEHREDGRDEARERRACARALVDERLRHAAAHRKPDLQKRLQAEQVPDWP
jgi:hypothetical protein